MALSSPLLFMGAIMSVSMRVIMYSTKAYVQQYAIGIGYKQVAQVSLSEYPYLSDNLARLGFNLSDATITGHGKYTGTSTLEQLLAHSTEADTSLALAVEAIPTPTVLVVGEDVVVVKAERGRKAKEVMMQ